jgi:hypothetical protein
LRQRHVREHRTLGAKQTSVVCCNASASTLTLRKNIPQIQKQSFHSAMTGGRLSNILKRAEYSSAVQHVSLAAQQRCILARPENYFGLFLHDAE